MFNRSTTTRRVTRRGSPLLVAHRRCGFSLVDVTVTMLIIGILAGVAAPKLGDTLNFYRVQSASQQLAADLKLAQRHA